MGLFLHWFGNALFRPSRVAHTSGSAVGDTKPAKVWAHDKQFTASSTAPWTAWIPPDAANTMPPDRVQLGPLRFMICSPLFPPPKTAKVFPCCAGGFAL